MAARLYVRRFLNLPEHHAGAYLLAEVEETSPDDDADTIADATLVLTDCTRQISLDFPLWSAHDRRNSIHKARLLAREFTRFADALETEARLIDQRQTDDLPPARPERPVRARRAERRGRPGHTQSWTPVASRRRRRG
jgi:hypothetical protein